MPERPLQPTARATALQRSAARCGSLRPARCQQQELSNTKDYSGAPIALTAAAAARVTLSTTATKATTTFTAGDVRCRDRRLEGACESG